MESSPATTPKKLSGFEWFGLISGVVGLGADIISLSVFFYFSQSQQSLSTEGFHIPSFLSWLIIFFALSYTIFIVSYFIHRINLRHYKKNGLYQYKEKKISDGVEVIVFLIGMPLYLIHFVFLFFIVRGIILTMDIDTLKRFVGETNYFSALFRLGVAIALFGFAVSLGMTLLMNICARTVLFSLGKAK